ncbi:hypothetical protein [uncultured Mobiluncus sp.]|uniref:hypothetical protein n=1 Tax=uncultured Mobiluncus sp. TaxID=293425 RepID=UPI002627B063|nr:hypothetical protein [uncultured Mobiluncus sp.]
MTRQLFLVTDEKKGKIMAGTPSGHIGSIRISVMPDLDGFRRKLRRELEEIEKSEQAHLRAVCDEFEIDNTKLNQAKEKLHREFSDLPPVKLEKFDVDRTKVKETKSRLKRELNDVNVTVNADADIGYARAKLIALTRPRRVHIGTVFEDTGHVAQFLAAITGLKTIDKTTLAFRNLADSFDKVSLVGLTAYGIIGNLTGALLGASGGIINFGGGVAKASKAALAAPAAFTAAAIGTGVFIASIKDASKVLDDIKPRFSSLQDSLSASFWERAEQPIRDFVDVALPAMDKGLTKTAASLGKVTAELINLGTETANDGRMAEMFDATTDAINRSSKGVVGFIDGFMRMADQGNKQLPRMADWFTKMGTRFDDFVKRTVSNGDFDRWIEDGITGLKDMWVTVKQGYRVFEGFYQTTITAAGGMSGINQQLEKFADMVNRDTFQSKFKTILDGAREGMSGLVGGLADFGTALGNESERVAAFLKVTGEGFGKLGTMLAHVLSAEEVQAGFDNLMGSFTGTINNFSGAVMGLEPTIGSFLTAVGHIAESVTGTLGSALQTAQPLIKGVLDLVSLAPPPLIAFGAGFLTIRKNMELLNPLMNATVGQLKSFNQYMTILQNKNFSRPISAMGAALVTVQSAATRAGVALKGLFLDNAPALALTALAAVIGAVAQKSAEAARQQEELKSTLDETTGAVTQQTVEWIAANQEFAKQAEMYEQLGGAAEDYYQALGGNAEAIKTVKATLEEANAGMNAAFDTITRGRKNVEVFGDTAKTTSQAVGILTDSINHNSATYQQGQREAANTQKATEYLRGEVDNTSASYDKQKEAVDRAIDALKRYQSNAADEVEAEHQHKEALDRLTQAMQMGGNAVNALGNNWDGATEKGYKAKQATDQFRNALIDQAKVMMQQHVPIDQIRAKLDNMVNDFMRVAGQMDNTGQHAQFLKQQYDLFPQHIITQVNADFSPLNNQMNQINGRTLGYGYIDAYVRVNNESSRGHFVSGYADGGIVTADKTRVKSFARGSERHVAQIAPAGSYRLWAESETGGEAYIPLSPSKRVRSLNILKNVADKFGYGLSKYADGGMTDSYADSGGGNTYNINMNVDAKDLRDLRDLSQFVDMLSLQMKMGVE